MRSLNMWICWYLTIVYTWYWSGIQQGPSVPFRNWRLNTDQEDLIAELNQKSWDQSKAKSLCNTIPSMLLLVSLLQTERGLNKVFIISWYRMQHANLKSLKNTVKTPGLALIGLMFSFLSWHITLDMKYWKVKFWKALQYTCAGSPYL